MRIAGNGGDAPGKTVGISAQVAVGVAGGSRPSGVQVDVAVPRVAHAEDTSASMVCSTVRSDSGMPEFHEFQPIGGAFRLAGDGIGPGTGAGAAHDTAESSRAKARPATRRRYRCTRSILACPRPPLPREQGGAAVGSTSRRAPAPGTPLRWPRLPRPPRPRPPSGPPGWPANCRAWWPKRLRPRS